MAQSTPIPHRGSVAQPESIHQSLPSVSQVNAPMPEMDIDVDMPSALPDVQTNETDNGFGPENQQELQQDVRSALHLSGEEVQPAPEHVNRLVRILSQEQREQPQGNQAPTEEDRPIRRVSAAND